MRRVAQRVAPLVLCSLAVFVVAGCGSGRTVNVGGAGGNSGGGNPPPGGTGGGTATVDFATQIQPIFTDNCAFSGCHASDTASGGLVLETGKAYGNLVNVASSEVAPDKRVLPSNSNGSYIIEKLTRAQPRSGGRMPFGAGSLPSDQITLIRTWIDEGAKPAK